MHQDIKSKLIEFIKEFYVVDRIIVGLPPYEEKKTDKLYILHRSIVNSQKKLSADFSKEELGYFIVDKISDKLKDKYEYSSIQENPEKLVDLLDDTEIGLIVTTILQKVESLPFQYKIYFNLGVSHPNFSKLSLKLDQNFQLKGIDSSTLPREGFNAISPIQKAMYKEGKNEIKAGESLAIELILEGYVHEYAITPNLERAISNIKMVIGLMLVFDILKVNYYEYISFYYQKSCFIFGPTTEFIRTVEFEHQLSESLHRLDLHEEAFKVRPIMILGKGKQPNEIEILESKFSYIEKYLIFLKKSAKAKEDKEYSERINNILHWYLIGIAAENRSVGLVTLMFAFESLFGVGMLEREERKASGLAGRCAYFISEDFKNRKLITDKVIEIYKLRNAIVHEGKQIKTQEEVMLYYNLLTFLQISLNKEIRNIKS